MESLSTEAAEALRAFREQLAAAPGAADRTWARIESTQASGAREAIVERHAAESRDARVRTRRTIAPLALAVAAAALVLLGVGFLAGRGSLRLSATAEGSGEQAPYDANARAPSEPVVQRASAEEAAELEAAPAVEPEPEAAPAVEPEPEAAPAVEPEAAPAVVPEPEPAPSRSRGRRRPEPAPSTGSDLAAEIDLLRRTKQALGRGATAEALELLEEHRRRFPRGQMAADRNALQLEARCGRGPKDRVKALRFVEEHPSSPYAGRIRKACGADARD